MLLEHFVKTRPFLYHLTADSNLQLIRDSRTLSSAAEIIGRARRSDLLRARRRQHERVVVKNAEVVLRDQAPLHRGNLVLPAGFSFEDFIESLNGRIFFWPGSEAGPISYGVRHFERYQHELPAILRVPTESLIAANPDVGPQCCRYNSGSPRCNDGKPSPRGPNTFVALCDFTGTPSQVVEVTFGSEIGLPSDTTVGSHPLGPWSSL